MRKINCIAIDDEPMALEVISQYASRIGSIELKTFSSPRAGLAAIESEHPDLVLLDIEMKSMNGLDIARTIPPETTLIFITAYEQYALKGFDLDAVDFLHKPIAYDRFERAISKAMIRINQMKANAQNDTIVVKQEYNNIVVNLDEVVYFEAMENYVKIVRPNGKTILTRMQMKTLREMLPEGKFICVHRSFVVAVSQIKSYSYTSINLGQVTLPIGRTYLSQIQQYIKK